jgi:hypothetical protein
MSSTIWLPEPVVDTMGKSARAIWRSMNKPSRAFERLMSRKSPVVVEPIKEADVAEKPLPQRKVWETENVQGE